MITNLAYRQNTGLKSAGKALLSLRTKPQELKALRPEKAAQETMFRQGRIENCFFIAVIKSIMFALNEYATKTGKHCYDARSFLRKLVVLDKNKTSAEVCFPLHKKMHIKIKTHKSALQEKFLSQGNPRVQFLESAYGILVKSIDKAVKNAWCVNQALDGGFGFLVMRDLTGLKSFKVTQERCITEEQKESYRKYTAKLFKIFKKYPEKLIITLNAKKMPPLYEKSYCHAFSLKRVVHDGLIIVDPRSQINEEIKISFNEFYKYFSCVDFARMKPEKMFKMIEQAKKTKAQPFDYMVYRNKPTSPIRDTNGGGHFKRDVFYNIKDNIL